MAHCGIATLVFVFIMLVMGALYAQANRQTPPSEGSGTVELARGGYSLQQQRAEMFNNVNSRGRQGHIADSGGPPQEGSERGHGRGGRRTRGRRRRIGGGGRRRGSTGGGGRGGSDSNVRRTLRRARRLGNATTPFATRLWGQVYPDLSHDAVLSSHIVHTAMTMVLLGARGRTERQITNTLGLRQARLRGPRAHRAYQALLRSLTHTHRDVHVLSANGAFVKPLIPLELNFRRQLQIMYMAQFDMFNSSHPDGAVGPINQWVDEQTRGQITDLLPPDSIGDDTAMVLVSALFLNASWAQPFSRDLTQRRPFTSFSEGTKWLDSMETTGIFRYGSLGGSEVIELPFKGERLVMDVILPALTSNVSTLLSQLTGEDSSQLRSLLSTVEPSFMTVRLPKFTIDSGMVDVKGALQRMGIRRAFNARRANFTGISVTQLHVDDVYHKAVIDVNEDGTMAAAASAVYFSPRSAISQRRVVVDRPFAFVVRDSSTDTLLFLGAFLGQARPQGT